MALGGSSRKQCRSTLPTRRRLFGSAVTPSCPFCVAAVDFRVFASGHDVIRKNNDDGPLQILPRLQGLHGCRDDRSHPPALEFIRVNRPTSDMPLQSALPARIPTLTSGPRYHPQDRSVRVVSHHLDGLRPPEVLGLLRPSTGQDPLNFEQPRPPPKWSPYGDCSVSAFHTLRRVPLTGSRTASLRPFPPRRSPGCTCAWWPHDQHRFRAPLLGSRIGPKSTRVPPACSHPVSECARQRPSTVWTAPL